MKKLDEVMGEILQLKALELVIEECQKKIDTLKSIDFNHSDMIKTLEFILTTQQALFKHLFKMKTKKKKKKRFWKKNETMFT